MAYCKVCGAKDQSAFYASIATYCKEHWREHVRKNRIAKIDYYQAFDRARGSMPHRVAARKSYQKTPEGRKAHRRATEAWASRFPERRAASNAASNAIRDGKLTKQACFVCGAPDVEAHHPDYSRPLDVVWLCEKHHKEIHWNMDLAA